MSSDMKKVFKNLDDLERRVTKSNKIAQKGEKIGYGDAIKLGRKSNSITSTINKGIKDYDVSDPALRSWCEPRTNSRKGRRAKRRRRKEGPHSDDQDRRID